MTKNGVATFLNDTSERKVTVAVGPMTVRAMVATNDNASAINVNMYFFDGTREMKIATVTADKFSGIDGVAVGTDLLNNVDNPWVQVDVNGNNVIRLGEHETLRVGVTIAPAAGKRLDVVAFGDDE